MSLMLTAFFDISKWKMIAVSLKHVNIAAIIKSPEYRERTDETYRAQHVPFEVISSESEDEILESTRKKHTPPASVPSDSDFSPDGNVTYQISAIVALNNSANECELFLKPVSNKSLTTIENAQGSPVTQSSTSPKQPDSVLDKTNNSDDYTLTELQPVENNRQFPQDAFQSTLDTADQNANIEPAALTETGMPDDEEEVLLNDEEEVLLSDEEDSEELSEQQRCLKLNRKYQAIIEVQMRKIEKLIIENREQQFRLSQTSSSSLANEEENEHRQLAAYINPYFRVTRKE
ncbi:Hypothetical predicted protein, partial [Paramuricea clavata]